MAQACVDSPAGLPPGGTQSPPVDLVGSSVRWINSRVVVAYEDHGTPQPIRAPVVVMGEGRVRLLV